MSKSNEPNPKIQQDTARDFNVTLAEMHDPNYDFTALHAWIGEAQLQIARRALAKAGVVVHKRTTNAADTQTTES